MIIIPVEQTLQDNNVPVHKNHKARDNCAFLCFFMVASGIITLAVFVFIDMANSCVGYMEEWTLLRHFNQSDDTYTFEITSPKEDPVSFQMLSPMQFSIGDDNSTFMVINFKKPNFSSSEIAPFWPSWNGQGYSTNISMSYNLITEKYTIHFNNTKWETGQISQKAIPSFVQINREKDDLSDFPSKVSINSQTRLCIRRELDNSQKLIIIATAISYAIR